jgi:hypothetical protein
MTVNIALRRQLWQLDYFSEGSIPDALIGVPASWTPEQIKQFQDYWDTEFAGDLARRRRAKFVPGDSARTVHQTKEPQHKDDFDEWLARIVCFAFSVPPQWAVKQMNRATADNQSAQSEEEGLEPTKEWVKDLVDEIIAEEFASPDLELHWLDEDDHDPETVLADRLKLGAVTLNEMRGHLGLDPYANPAADRAMVLTPTGYVPIEANAGREGAEAQAAPAVQKYNPTQARVPAGNPDGGQWTSEGGAASTTANEADRPTPTRPHEIVSDASPDPIFPGAQYAQNSPRGGGGGRRGSSIGGPTLGQGVRLEFATARWRDAMSLVRAVDPNWKPTPGLYGPEDSEGEIATLEAQTREAQNRFAEVTGIDTIPAARGGQHYVPRALYESFQDAPLREDTRKFFDGVSSGPLADPSANWFTTQHRAYNEAVAGAFRAFLAKREITSDEMTPEMGREFLNEIFRSNDPRIHDFNSRVFEERSRYILRNRVLGGNNDDE